MSWIAFVILAYGAVALQTAVAPLLRVGASEPNFVLVVMVFIALYAPRQAALLGAFVLGAMQDLASSHPFGLLAFSYGLAAWAAIAAAQAVHRDHPLSHFFCAILAGAVTAGVVLLHARLHRTEATGVTSFAGALYTALLAPFLVGGLQRMKGLFAFGR
jgi:rod shape-determining protein MreD